MDSETDSLFGEFLPPERALNRFRPKACPKNVKPSLPPSKLPDSTRLVPSTLEPSPNAPDLKCSGEKSNLPDSTTDGSFTNASTLDVIQESFNQPNGSHSEPSVPDSDNVPDSTTDGSFTNASTLDVVQESFNQPNGSHSEPSAPDSDNVVALHCNHGESSEVADTSISTEFLNFAQLPSLNETMDAGTFSNIESLHDDSDPALATSDLNALGGSNIGSNDIEAPKPKRAPKKSKRQIIGDEKPVRKRKKASEVLTSAEQETTKKKFPHGTQRRRRQVNKVLLETPEEEIDRNQLSLKDLIMLGEFKERTLNKDARTSNKSSPNRRGSLSNNPFGDEQYDGDEENQDTERSSPKLNYHYLMARSSGRWSKSETERFYQALRQFGENFAMIEKLFPGRTRDQIRNKYKKEYLKHKEQLNDASSYRSKDHSLFKVVIQKLREEAEQNTYKEEVTN